MLNSKRLLSAGCLSAVVALEVVGIMGLSIARDSVGALPALAVRPVRATGGKRGICPLPAGQSARDQSANLVAFLPELPPPASMLASTATPTLYFYVPDRPNDLGNIQLRLSHGADTSDQTTAAVTPIAPPQTPGVLKVQLPNALKPGVKYSWTLSFKCKTNRTSLANFSGVVTYAPLDAKLIAALNHATSVPQQVAIYTTADRWLDAMQLLMEHEQLSTKSFAEILAAIGWEQPIYPDPTKASVP